MNLTDLGWKPVFETSFAKFVIAGRIPARVVREERELYLVCCEQGEFSAAVSGKFRHDATARADFPAVGDWVTIETRRDEGAATIHAVLPRLSKFSRSERRQRLDHVAAAGLAVEEQIISANVDTAFIVCGLDGDFNPRRVERYIAATYEGGAIPVIVLNKADVCADVAARCGQVESVALGVPIHAISALENEGLGALQPYLFRGQTIALLGSSGVGKSTLINALLGEERQLTAAVREYDSRGRHTTTRRELIALPSGALLVDNPGMRELQLWSDEENLDGAFADVETLAAACHFRDCTHATEPSCAIQEALANGSLSAERYKSYCKLQRELRHLAQRQDQRARLAEKARWKQINKDARARRNERHDGE